MHRLRSRTFSIRKNRQNDYDTIPAHTGLTRSRSLIQTGKSSQPDTPPPLPPPRKTNLLKVDLAHKQISRSMDLRDVSGSARRMTEGGSLSDCHSDFSDSHCDSDAFPGVEHQTRPIDEDVCPNTPVITVDSEVRRGILTRAKSQSTGDLPLPGSTDYGDYVVMESTGSSRWSLNQHSPEPEGGTDCSRPQGCTDSPSTEKCSDCGGTLPDVTARLDELSAKINVLTKLFERDNPGRVAAMANGACETQCSVTQSLPSTDSAAEQNKATLRSLSCDQVLGLLEAMNMSQYKESFQREQVNGEILLEFDEEILKNELHISSRIHRIRLTKIITGMISVHDYIKESTQTLIV